MAWTVTDRGFAQHSSSSADLVSDTFTPAAGVILVAHAISVDGAATNITGIVGHDGGDAWQQIYYGENEGPQANKELEFWACLTGGSPSSGAITVSVNYQAGCQIQFIEIDETAGFDASVENNFGTPVAANQYNVAEPTVTVSAFAAADNLAACMIHQNGGTPGALYEPSTGYTELGEAGTIWPGTFMYKGSEDTTISAQVNTGNVYSALVGYEIKHAAVGGATPKGPLGLPLTGPFGGPI